MARFGVTREQLAMVSVLMSAQVKLSLLWRSASCFSTVVSRTNAEPLTCSTMLSRTNSVPLTFSGTTGRPAPPRGTTRAVLPTRGPRRSAGSCCPESAEKREKKRKKTVAMPCAVLT
eukprot:3428684-Rhodomonas_salina.1